MAKRKPIKVSHPGALTAKAKAAGKTINEFCSSLGAGASTSSKRQCALYENVFKPANRKRRKH